MFCIDQGGRTIDMIREEGLKRGTKFYNMERTETGVKSKRTMDPGPEAVLNYLRYTPAEAEALAGALYQLDSARRSWLIRTLIPCTSHVQDHGAVWKM